MTSQEIVTPRQEQTKPCTKCKDIQPLSCFSRNKQTPDGLQKHCKICVKQYQDANRERIRKHQQEWRDNNRENERQRANDYDARNRSKRKAYYHANKERLNAYGKEYHAKNRDEILEKKRAYDALNRERFLIRQRRFRAANIDRIRRRHREFMKSAKGKALTANRYARMKGANGSYTAQELQQQLERQKHRCYYCKSKLGENRKSYHADHIVPLAKGGTNYIDNIVTTCPACNFRKNDKLLHEWTEGGRLC